MEEFPISLKDCDMHLSRVDDRVDMCTDNRSRSANYPKGLLPEASFSRIMVSVERSMSKEAALSNRSDLAELAAAPTLYRRFNQGEKR
jgi:hypothetical protein